MKNKSKERKNQIVISIILSVLILIIAFFSYKQPQVTKEIDQFSNSNETHWTHMPLTYNFEKCESHFKGKYINDIENALKYIENKTDNVIKFKRIYLGKEDITFKCQIDNSKLKLSPITNETKYKTFITAQAVPYIYTSPPNSKIFSKGEVYIYSTKKCLGKKPVVLIHETLHLLNLQHTPNNSTYISDIMHPENSNCYADISKKDIDYLKRIYKK